MFETKGLPLGLSALIATLLIACSDSGGASGEGCEADTDCKGDRICEAGVCVSEGPGAGGESSGTGNQTSGGQGSGGQPTTSGSDPGGPTFLSFATNVSAIAWDESVVFTAVLTDPDGADDVIGGALKAPSGAAYGAFATSGQEGAYQLNLSWEQIDQLEAIEFELAADGQRTFIAEFFDGAGNRSERQISLTFDCGGFGACGGYCAQLRCDGECVYANTDENCGSCGNACGYGYCDEGSCWGAENSNALCSDGLDNDDDGYFDCVDFNCSKNASVTVCD